MIGNSGINGVARGLPYLDWQISKHVSTAFTGGTPSSHGAFATTPTYTIWTVTGNIIIQAMWGDCNTSLVGGATLESGVTGETALILSIETDVSATILINTVWAVQDNGGFGSKNSAQFRDNSVIINGSGTNIIETCGTANITAGQMDYYCIWAPASAGASLVNSGALS